VAHKAFQVLLDQPEKREHKVKPDLRDRKAHRVFKASRVKLDQKAQQVKRVIKETRAKRVKQDPQVIQVCMLVVKPLLMMLTFGLTQTAHLLI
jgi:hypothetical protein